MTRNSWTTLPGIAPASNTSCGARNQTMSDWNDKVRDAMKRRGMTNLQLATELGVNQTTIGRWLNGLSTPGVGTLRHIGSILGIKLVEAGNADTGVAQETELLVAFRRMTATERSLLLHCLRDRDLRYHNGPEDTDG
jgi:transcriptional regulator with XRE-family HTH domain